MGIVPFPGWGGSVRASKIKNDSGVPAKNVAAALDVVYAAGRAREWTYALSMHSEDTGGALLIPVPQAGEVRRILMGLGASPGMDMTVDFSTSNGSMGPTYTITPLTPPGYLSPFVPGEGTGVVAAGDVVSIMFDRAGNLVGGFLSFTVQFTAAAG